jgi:uncharacterized lipoprotein YddW (UPF0748 family)
MRRIALIALLLVFAAAAPAQEIRAFWVDGFNQGFKTPEQVDTLLARVRRANCNAIFAQMRKSADAYYLSRYDPWAADDPQRFDALADLIRKAHGSAPRIAVHAWLNTCAVGKSHGNPHHIARAHPEYLSLSDAGADYDNEAVKIDPGNPAAADWTFRVYLDVVRHYPDVDGIHFDFVRYGGARWGYNPVSVARFNARFGRSGQPAFDDPAWKQWRRDQVTALVRKVYTMAAAVAPRVAVSAATITWGDGPGDLADWNEKSAPMNRVFQDWRAWMREGILDLNCLMSYYQESKRPDMFRHWIDWAKDNQYGRWAVPSSGCWLNTIADTLRQIEAIRKPSRRGNRARGGVLLYCYAGTNVDADGAEQSYNDAFYDALSQPSGYAERPPFARPSAYPELPWKAHPRRGHVQGFVLDARGLQPVDGALVAIRGKTHRVTRTDGTGYYAFVDLPPGAYRVDVRSAALGRVSGRTSVRAGGVAACNLMLGPPGGQWSDAMTERAWQATPSGAQVRLRSARVLGGSDTFPGNLYVRTAGGATVRIRLVVAPALPFQPGDLVALAGAVGMDGGERCVDAAVAQWVGVELWPDRAIPLRSDDLAERPEQAAGLAALEGRVTEVLGDRFLLEAGRRVEVLLSGRKDPGVESPEEPLPAPAAGARVRVRGILTVTRQADGSVYVRLRPRTSADLEALPQPSLWPIGGAATAVAACFRGLVHAAEDDKEKP